MRLTKKAQYGLLLALYLSEKGIATIEEASVDLALSPTFLAQVAVKLRKSNVLRSKKGPDGGYLLNGDPTVSDVLQCLAPALLLSVSEASTYARGTHNHRSLVYFAVDLFSAMSSQLNRRIRNVANNINQREDSRISKLPLASTSMN